MALVYGNPSPLPSAVVTNTHDSGSGSLRAALYYAFDKSTDQPPVPTTVVFNIPTSDPGNIVSGCYIGTNATGTTAMPNTFPGIEIVGGAHSNTIGGTTAAARNLISGNAHIGVSIHDSGSTTNVVEGNYIGLNATGTAALPNAYAGVEIFGGATNNTIG